MRKGPRSGRLCCRGVPLRRQFMDRSRCLQAGQGRVERPERQAREQAEIPAQPFAQVIAVHRVLLEEAEDREFEHSPHYINSTYRCDMSSVHRTRSSRACASLELRSATVGDAVGQGTFPPAGWYRDPWGMAPLRWWDGRNWTAFTSATPRGRGCGSCRPGRRRRFRRCRRRCRSRRRCRRRPGRRTCREIHTPAVDGRARHRARDLPASPTC